MEKKLNNLSYLKKELKEIKEVESIKRWSKTDVNIILQNDLSLYLDFNYSSFIVVDIYYKGLKLKREAINNVTELKQLIKQYKNYNKNFLDNLLIFKDKIQQIFFYDFGFYLSDNILSIHFSTKYNNIDRLCLTFNDDVIEIKLIYNIGVNEDGLIKALEDITQEKARKTELLTEALEEIFKKEVVINNKDYEALEKDRIFNFIGDIMNAIDDGNTVVIDEIIEEFLRELN